MEPFSHFTRGHIDRSLFWIDRKPEELSLYEADKLQKWELLRGKRNKIINSDEENNKKGKRKREEENERIEREKERAKG